jgi:hypothetical protein
MPLKREIIYPVFLECCQFTNDIFWENIFEELAYGRPPQGTYISKDFLTCSYKNKEFSYKIERKEPEILYNELYKLLTEKLLIVSQKEKIQSKILFDEMKKNIKESRLSWMSIRKKNVKDNLYEKYILEMKNKYQLSIKQCRYLFSLINVCNTFKTITSKDIIYENEKIIHIEGIEFEKGKILFQRSLTLDKETDYEDEVNENSFMLYLNWYKYLKNFKS